MIKKLSAYVKEYKTAAVLTSVMVMMEVVMEVVIPRQMSKIIDIGLPGGDIGYVTKIGLIMILMAVMSLCFGVGSGLKTGAVLQSAGFVFFKHRQILNFKPCNKAYNRCKQCADGLYHDDKNVGKSAYYACFRHIYDGKNKPQIITYFLCGNPCFGSCLDFCYDKSNAEIQTDVQKIRCCKSCGTGKPYKHTHS